MNDVCPKCAELEQELTATRELLQLCCDAPLKLDCAKATIAKLERENAKFPAVLERLIDDWPRPPEIADVKEAEALLAKHPAPKEQPGALVCVQCRSPNPLVDEDGFSSCCDAPVRKSPVKAAKEQPHE